MKNKTIPTNACTVGGEIHARNHDLEHDEVYAEGHDDGEHHTECNLTPILVRS